MNIVYGTQQKPRSRLGRCLLINNGEIEVQAVKKTIFLFFFSVFYMLETNYFIQSHFLFFLVFLVFSLFTCIICILKGPSGYRNENWGVNQFSLLKYTGLNWKLLVFKWLLKRLGSMSFFSAFQRKGQIHDSFPGNNMTNEMLGAGVASTLTERHTSAPLWPHEYYHAHKDLA